MKIKKEYVLLPVVIAALCAYLVFRNSDRTHYQLPKVPEIAEADISKMEIHKGTASIVLNRKGSGWEISPQGYAADPARVKALLDTLKNLTLTALVSEKKDYNRYDLSGEDTIRVRAWAAGALKRDLEIGKPASTYRHTFVKLAGDDRVYHARENFRSRFDQTVEGLRDKTILAFQPGEIREISISKGDETLVLSRREIPRETKSAPEKAAEKTGPPGFETTWESTGGEKADREAVTDILSELSNLKCERYLEGAKADLDNPIYSIGLKGTKDYRLSIYAKKQKDAKGYTAVSSESGSPFFLPDRRADEIMKGPGKLLTGARTEVNTGTK